MKAAVATAAGVAATAAGVAVTQRVRNAGGPKAAVREVIEQARETVGMSEPAAGPTSDSGDFGGEPGGNPGAAL